MKNLIVARNAAQIEVDKLDKLLYEFCLNKYYDLDYRFETWEKEITKRKLEQYVKFNSLDRNFKTPPPNCILDFEDNMDGHRLGSHWDYTDLIQYVEEEQHDFAPEDLIELKEWLIKENVGEWVNV